MGFDLDDKVFMRKCNLKSVIMNREIVVFERVERLVVTKDNKDFDYLKSEWGYNVPVGMVNE